jgi:ComF family protein
MWTLGSLLADKAKIINNIDLVIPVPLHRDKLKKRGFNQSQILAGYVSKKLGTKLDTKSLIRVKNTNAQSTLSRKGRLRNMEKAFVVLNNRNILNKKILIVDDIYTTGTIVSECAKALKAGGAREIIILTVASGKGF